MSHEFSPGDIFVFSPGDKGTPCNSDPDWVTTPIRTHNIHMLYEQISLTSYPSSADFHGDTVEVSPGDVGIVLQARGLPHMLWHLVQNRHMLCDKYTVYEVMINDKKMNCFGGDMRAIIKYKAPENLSSLD